MQGALLEIYGFTIIKDKYTLDNIAHREKGTNKIYVSSKVYKALKEAKNSEEIEAAIKGVKVFEIEPFDMKFYIDPEIKFEK